MDIRAAEISAILKQQIANFGTEAEVAEVGQVLSVGDGIARVYGLDSVKAGEMVEFPGGIEHRQQRLALKVAADHRTGDESGKLGALGEKLLEGVEILGDLVERLGIVRQLEKRAGIASGDAGRGGC